MYGFAFTFPPDATDPRLQVQALFIDEALDTPTEAEHEANQLIGSDELAYWPAGTYEVSIVNIDTMEIALSVEIELPEAVLDPDIIKFEDHHGSEDKEAD